MTTPCTIAEGLSKAWSDIIAGARQSALYPHLGWRVSAGRSLRALKVRGLVVRKVFRTLHGRDSTTDVLTPLGEQVRAILIEQEKSR